MQRPAASLAASLALLLHGMALAPAAAYNSLIRSTERAPPAWVDIDDPAPSDESLWLWGSNATGESHGLFAGDGGGSRNLLFTEVDVWSVGSSGVLNQFYAATNVVDKVPTTYWVSRSNGNSALLKIGLTEAFTPKFLKLKWYTSGSYNSAPAASYTVKVSTDNINWDTIQDFDCLEQGTCDKQSTKSSGLQCESNRADDVSLATLTYPIQFVQVDMTKLCGNFYFAMEELELIRWDYKEFGDDWPEYYKVCNSTRQSPIDLPLSADELTSGSGELIDLAVEYTGAQSDLILRNLGQSIRLDMPDGKLLSFTAPITPLQRSALYTLANVHFHWSCDESAVNCTTSRGSEHTIGGVGYHLEAQLMHWNTKYTGWADAASYEDGLLGISVLFELGEDSGVLEGLLEDVSAISRQKRFNQTTSPVSRFVPSSLLPEERGKYWTYLGSDTSPDCFEVRQPAPV
jgi:carbonic anhydrase